MLYGHGDDIYKYNVSLKANFSSNVLPEGTSEKLKEHLKVQLDKIGSYPSPNADDLTEKIVEHHNLENNTVLVTNGATEAFYTIANTFKRKHVSIGIPTFMEYESACMNHDIDASFFPRKEVALKSFVEEIVFLCNPNNPDGYSNSISEIENLLKKNSKTIFVLDEAYIDFTLEIDSCISLLHTYENLIIVKSLTKLFAIPGLRLGYIISSKSIIKKLLNFKMPWSVNALAIESGKFIFDTYDTLHPNIKPLIEEAKELQKSIQQIKGFTVIPSDTNYFLVKLDKPLVADLKEYLVYKYQLLIRNAANFNGLDNHYMRIASQNKEKNQLLINALNQWK